MNELEQALNYLQPIADSADKSMSYGKMLNVALDALREKLDRSKGCEYCNEEKIMPSEDRYTGFYLAENALTFSTQPAADDVYEVNTFVNFCPMCGRPLTKEATHA